MCKKDAASCRMFLCTFNFYIVTLNWKIDHNTFCFCTLCAENNCFAPSPPCSCLYLCAGACVGAKPANDAAPVCESATQGAKCKKLLGCVWNRKGQACSAEVGQDAAANIGTNLGNVRGSSCNAVPTSPALLCMLLYVSVNRMLPYIQLSLHIHFVRLNCVLKLPMIPLILSNV